MTFSLKSKQVSKSLRQTGSSDGKTQKADVHPKMKKDERETAKREKDTDQSKLHTMLKIPNSNKTE